jgi:hypothetical protein
MGRMGGVRGESIRSTLEKERVAAEGEEGVGDKGGGEMAGTGTAGTLRKGRGMDGEKTRAENVDLGWDDERQCYLRVEGRKSKRIKTWRKR